MKYKYILLKTSWGIVIFLDMEVLENPEVRSSDEEITKNAFFRIDTDLKLKREIVSVWFKKALNELLQQFPILKEHKNLCYVLRGLDFNLVDFQEEGLYCAVREWFSNYYNVVVAKIESYYDSGGNKYIFPGLKDAKLK